jgi:hypothetical protein
MDRLYCTAREIADELDNERLLANPATLRHIRSASSWIDRRAGWFIPVTAARRFDTRGGQRLEVDPLLAVTSLVDDTTTLAATDYLLYPRNRHWENGPYTRISPDPDGTHAAWSNERDAVVLTGRWGKYEATSALGVTVANTTEIGASGTTLKASDGSALSPGMVLLVESEQMLVTAVADLTAAEFTVLRGINGTTAATHANAIALSRYLPPWDVNWLALQMAALMTKKAETGFSGRAGSAELGEAFYFREFPDDPIKRVVENYRIVSL